MGFLNLSPYDIFTPWNETYLIVLYRWKNTKEAQWSNTFSKYRINLWNPSWWGTCMFVIKPEGYFNLLLNKSNALDYWAYTSSCQCKLVPATSYWSIISLYQTRSLVSMLLRPSLWHSMGGHSGLQPPTKYQAFNGKRGGLDWSMHIIPIPLVQQGGVSMRFCVWSLF